MLRAMRRARGLLGRIAPVAFAAALIVAAIVLFGELEDSSPPEGGGGSGESRLEERERERRERAERRRRGALVPPPQAYRGLIGREVEARAVIVQSVVDGAGFWIGPDRTQRVFVRTNGALVPERRGRVDVDGKIVTADAAMGRTLGLDADDRSSMRRVGALIEARRVRRAAAGR